MYRIDIHLKEDAEPILHLDRKCSACLIWVYRDDNYCANCGAKFGKEEKKNASN